MKNQMCSVCVNHMIEEDILKLNHLAGQVSKKVSGDIRQL